MNLRSSAAVVVSVAFAIAVSSCRRAPQPSPEYSEAATRFGQLYGEKLDDAYVDPQMADVEALLEKVPADSMDTQGAHELLARIRDNRARVQAEEKKAKEQEQAALQPSSNGPVTFSESLVPAAPDAGAEDAGEPERPRTGMPFEEFQAKFSRCFEPGPKVFVGGHGERDTYQLVDSAVCRDQYSEYAKFSFFFEDGKLGGILNRPAAEPPPVRPTPTPAPAPASDTDAGADF